MKRSGGVLPPGFIHEFMSSFFYDQFGRQRKWEHVRAVDHLYKLKQKSGSDPWPVVEAVIKVWEDTHPIEWEAYIVELRDIKRTRKDPKFASTYDKKNGGYLRYTLDIPDKVIKMIRTIYSVDELPMNKDFFVAFARKFPRFQIAQKL